MQIKILHMADVHFGRAVSGLPQNLRNIRRQEVRSAFSDAVNLAKEENVDVFLIAGDLFDSADTDKSTIKFIKGELSKIPHIPVFIAPGNHDPLGSAYKMLGEEDIENLTVFAENVSCVKFHEKQFAVYGIGFNNEIVNAPLLKSFKAEDDDFVNIGVIHGEMASNSDYNPITESHIGETNMDYIALGHVHTFSGIKKVKNTSYAYCGNLEGGGFDECGEKGVILGTVSKGDCNLKLHRLCKRVYHTVEIDVTETNTLQEIIEKVKEKIVSKDDLYKIVLTGKRPENIPEGVIENEIDVFFAKTKDLTRGSYDLKSISADYSIGGIFAKNVLQRMENADENEKTELMKAADIVMDILENN